MEIYTNGTWTFLFKYNLFCKSYPKKYIFYREKICHLILTLPFFPL